jgi:hypothetical protein
MPETIGEPDVDRSGGCQRGRVSCTCKQGCGFLVLHAPEDEAAKRAVATVKLLGLKFPEKYNQLTTGEVA